MAVKKTKKAPAKKKVAAKKAPAKKKVAAKKAPAKKKVAAKKAPAKKKVAAKKAPAKKKVAAKKAPAKKKVVAKKVPAKKKVVANKAPAEKKVVAKKVVADKSHEKVDQPKVMEVIKPITENDFINLKKHKALHDDPREHHHEEQTINEHVPHEPLAPITREEPKIGRNDPCPCGSGLKYKKCHGK